MKVVIDEKAIERNKKIGNYTTIISLVAFGAGIYLVFQDNLFQYSLVAILIGFIIQQISIFFVTRWGRSPRPDEIITNSLKGLDSKNTLYHYTSPVPHLLVGPSGAWILLPYYQAGKISYDEKKNRWHQKGGNFYMKIFGQESLGRPDLDIKGAEKDLRKFLAKKLPDYKEMEINSMLVFFNEKVEIENVENAPAPTLMNDKIKDFFRKEAKKNINKDLTAEDLLTKVLPTESIQ